MGSRSTDYTRTRTRPKLKQVVSANEPLTFRQPPHNLEAEQALLGAILVNNEALDRVSGFLSPDHFFDPLHGRIFETLATLIHAGKTATPITVKTFFENVEPIDANMTVPQYLGRLAANATTIINAAEYGRTIYDLSARRGRIIVGEELIAAAYDPTTTPEQLAEIDGRFSRACAPAYDEDRSFYPDDLDVNEVREPGLWGEIIPPGTAGILHGPTGSGKTFFTYALLSSIARGVPFMDLPVIRRPVLYIPVEGGSGGLKDRALAARIHYGATGRMFRIAPLAVSLGSGPGSQASVAEIIAEAKKLEKDADAPVGLIVVDTWAQAIGGGDDNASATTGAVFAQRRAITAATGAAVMFIDHPGKDGKLRGSSAKSCNADFEIEIERDERTGVSQVKTNKVRDEQRGPVCSFRLLQVDLPNGRTSRIVEAIDAPVISVSRKPIDRESQAGIALTELEHLIIGGPCPKIAGQ